MVGPMKLYTLSDYLDNNTKWEPITTLGDNTMEIPYFRGRGKLQAFVGCSLRRRAVLVPGARESVRY